MIYENCKIEKENNPEFNICVRKRRKKALLIVPLLVVLSVLIASGIIAYKVLTSRPNQNEFCTVPDISGMELSVAEKTLDECGLSLRIIGSSDGVGEDDTIVWQSVKQEEVMPRRGCIDVWVERSANNIWKWTEAEKTLREFSSSDFSCVIEYTNEPTVANNIVTFVEISENDAVVYINRTEERVVPDLNGMTEYEAAKLLDELGLAYIKDEAVDSKADKYTVISQYPQAGELLNTGDIMLLTVCSGIIEPPVFGIEIVDSEERNVTIGESIILSVNISPDKASLSKVEWNSSEPTVAVVEPTGKVTAVGEGSAVITAYSKNGKYKAEYEINVSDIIVGIEVVQKPKTNWLVGDEFSAQGLCVLAHTVGGKWVEITDLCKINGGDLSKEGTSSVTVEYSEGGRTMHAQFDIVCKTASLEINAENVMIGIQDRHTLHTVFTPSYVNVTYSSSDENVASVSDDGVITGVSKGDCTVTVEIDGGIKRECKVSVKDKVMYLTFDDGPNAYTYDILKVLKKYDVKGTFFCIYNARYMDRCKRIVEEGHAIGLHSYTHKYKKCYASVEAFMGETEKIQNLLYELTGEKSMIVRFPGGTNNAVSSREVMLGIIEQLLAEGYAYFDWNCYSYDAKLNTTAEEVARNVIDSCSENIEIALMHNKDFTADALEIIIPEVMRLGYVFKVISLDTPAIRSEVRQG